MSFQSDADALRALYIQLMEGWNAGSGEAFAAPFDEQRDFIAFDGARFRGREAFARFHEPLFATYLRDTRLVGEVTDVRFLSPEVAVMHARGGTIPRGRERPAPERDSIQTLVAARRNAVWDSWRFRTLACAPSAGAPAARCCGSCRTGSGSACRRTRGNATYIADLSSGDVDFAPVRST